MLTIIDRYVLRTGADPSAPALAFGWHAGWPSVSCVARQDAGQEQLGRRRLRTPCLSRAALSRHRGSSGLVHRPPLRLQQAFQEQRARRHACVRHRSAPAGLAGLALALLFTLASTIIFGCCSRSRATPSVPSSSISPASMRSISRGRRLHGDGSRTFILDKLDRSRNNTFKRIFLFDYHGARGQRP